MEPPPDKPDSTNHKLYGTTVFVSNLSEDVWPFISNITDPKAREYEIEENAFLVDRDLFSLAQEDRIVLLSPKPISKEFISYFVSLFGIKHIEILVPKNHSGKICEDAMADENIMKMLVAIANSSKKLTFLAYTTSHSFLELIKALREKGLAIYTPESPDDDSTWTVNFFGSKSGIRQLAQGGRVFEPDLRMPEGYICSGINDAAKIAAKKYLKEDGVVIKTYKGHSGLGVLIFRPGDLPFSYDETEAKILEFLSRDAYWDKFPIVIESLINVNTAIGGGFPNAEFKIQKSGEINLLYYCGLRVTKEGVFKGIEIGDDIFSERVAAQIIDTGFYIGERYAQAGYRGYYDVDFAVGKNGIIYVNESNVRRTGGTHVYHIAVELMGRDFMYDCYTLSNNGYALPEQKGYTFSEILQTLKPILFNKKAKEGIIIVSENLLRQNKLAYVIFGRNENRALDIEYKMEQLLEE